MEIIYGPLRQLSKALKEAIKAWREKVERDWWRADNELPPAPLDIWDYLLIGSALACSLILLFVLSLG
jgi:hypothetical protein